MAEKRPKKKQVCTFNSRRMLSINTLLLAIRKRHTYDNKQFFVRIEDCIFLNISTNSAMKFHRDHYQQCKESIGPTKQNFKVPETCGSDTETELIKRPKPKVNVKLRHSFGANENSQSSILEFR